MSELDLACEALRRAIRNERKAQDVRVAWNERKAQDVRVAWRKMALTCSQKREYEKKWLSNIYANDRR